MCNVSDEKRKAWYKWWYTLPDGEIIKEVDLRTGYKYLGIMEADGIRIGPWNATSQMSIEEE